MSRTSWIAAAIAFGLAAGGCNYFRPAQPELPGGAPVVPEIYTTVDRTLETIQLAIENKSTSNGQSAYIGAFAEDFTATFDPVTVSRFPGVPTDWDLDREEQFYSKVSNLNPGSTFTFTWGDFRGAPEDPEPTATTATIYRNYSIIATSDDGITSVPVVRGNVELHFVLVGTRWQILEWIDSEDPEADFDNDELSFGHRRLQG